MLGLLYDPRSDIGRSPERLRGHCSRDVPATLSSVVADLTDMATIMPQALLASQAALIILLLDIIVQVGPALGAEPALCHNASATIERFLATRGSAPAPVGSWLA